MDPERIPVIVGVGQVTHRPRGMDEIREPAELAAQAARIAAEDAGSADLLARLEMVCVANILSWGYADPVTSVASRIWADPRIRWTTGVGACAPQWFVAEAADRIAAGEIRNALICGGESYCSLSLAQRSGEPLPWKVEGGGPEIVGDRRLPLTEMEQRHQLFVPAHVYGLFENALRYSRRLGLQEHRRELAEFCAGLSRVASRNPYAWFREPKTAEEIETVSSRNRMVAFPYTKLMCSMMFVDQAAALIVTSLAEAGRWGVPPEKRVFPVGAGEASDLWYVTHRERYDDAPSARAAAGMALSQAGLGLEEVDYLDLYSCFPCAPRIVSDALGLSPRDPRGFTVTGGMPYFGGPGNNYSLHAISSLAGLLREDPGRTGLVHALSWFLHKHAVGVYRSGPPPPAWVRADPEPFLRELESLRSPLILESPSGKAIVETYSVVYHDDEPVSGFVIGRTVANERFLARVQERPETLRAMVTREVIGEKGAVHADREKGFNVFSL